MQTYTIETKGKINKDTIISLISDIHMNEKTTDKRLTSILKSLELTNPNYIFLLGDMIEDVRSSDKLLRRLEDYLTEFGYIAPVYYVHGNHETKTKLDGKWIEYNNEEYLLMLRSIERFHFLNNESILLEENIGLTGVNFPFSYYDIYNESKEEYMKLLASYINKNLIGILSSQSFNILLQHSPNNIMDRKTYSELLNYIKYSLIRGMNYNVIVSGHQHNGCIPSYADIFFPGNRGIMGISGSKKNLFQKDCRGIKEIDYNTTGIMLPAVSSLPEHPFLNGFFPPDGKTLILKK